MKKLLLLGMAFILSGCITTVKIDNDVYEGTPKVPNQKATVYCPNCDEDDITDYFFKGSVRDNYELKIESANSYTSSTGGKYHPPEGLWELEGFLNILSLGIIPRYWGSYEYVISGELINKSTNQSISLGKVDMKATDWGGWIFLPLMPFYPTWNDTEKDVCEKQASEIFLKMAALALYEPNNPALRNKWHCAGYSCRIKEIMAQKKTTAEDVIYVAENGPSYGDFERVKNKLAKPLNTDENCTVTRHLVQRQIVSKDTQRYWALIDFYKGNCAATDGFGMSKSELMSKKGVPSKGYRVNADTEMVTYSSLSRDGERVISTTYTLDRDIVTNVK